MKLLIVDDEKLTRDGLMSNIDWKSLGIDAIAQADDGLHGYEAALAFQPDIILSDVRMPRMSGIEMAEKLQLVNPALSIIFMSGYSDKEYLKAAIKLKAVSYVEKPIDLEELSETVLEAKASVEAVRKAASSQALSLARSQAALASRLAYAPKGGDPSALFSEEPEFDFPKEDTASFFTFLIQFHHNTYNQDTLTAIMEPVVAQVLDSLHLKEIHSTRQGLLYFYHVWGFSDYTVNQKNTLGKMLTHALSSFSLRYHIVFGKNIRGFLHIHDSYNSAVIELQNSFFHPDNTFRIYKHRDTYDTFFDVGTLHADSRLSEALLRKDKRQAENLLEELFHAMMPPANVLPNQAKDLYYKLFTTIRETYKILNLPDTAGKEPENSLWGYISECESIYELQDLLKKKNEDFFSRLQNRSENHSTVYLIKEFIAGHYQDETLSIKDISEHVFLSSSYICTLFKSETGQTLKFMITHLILVLVPTLVVFLFLYGRLSHIITTNTIESEQALVSQTADTLEATISQLSLSMDTITSNPFLSEATYTPDVYGYLSGKQNSTQALEFFSMINSLIDHEFITSIKIYIPSGSELQFSSPSFSGVISSVDDISGSYWHGIFAGQPDSISLLCPSFYLTPTEIDTLGSLAYIQKFTNLGNPNGECSYIAIYFSEDHLENMLHGNLTSTNSVYYIINSRNSLVASSNAFLAGTYFKRYEAIPEAVGSTEEFTTTTILDEDLYMGYREIDRTDWRLVSVIPVSSVFSEGQQVLINTAQLYLAFVVLACATALFLSGSLARRLSLVVEKINQNRQKSLVPFEDNSDQDKDEIGQLVRNYNAMVERINQLMEEQTETAEKLKVSEVKALQAQINPHFLYNMLDMINWLAQSGKQKEVSLAVQTLSKFYKLTLSKKNITTPIREELWHVELYVKLQNMRYEDKISFLIDVPDEILDFEIPKLVLQPIVENSIQHGIFEKESKEGTIVIMAWTEGNDIVFVISDDGVGILPEKVPLILDGTYEDGKGSNIGIYNTHLRLQLLYGKKYGLHYESTPGHGTEVQVKLPGILYQRK